MSKSFLFKKCALSSCTDQANIKIINISMMKNAVKAASQLRASEKAFAVLRQVLNKKRQLVFTLYNPTLAYHIYRHDQYPNA